MRRLTVVILSLALGAAISWAKLAYHCRQPTAEACVWGKAYLPIAFPAETILFGAVIFLTWSVLRRRSRG